MGVFELPGKPIYFSKQHHILVLETKTEVLYYHYTEMGRCDVDNPEARKYLDNVVKGIIENHEKLGIKYER